MQHKGRGKLLQRTGRREGLRPGCIHSMFLGVDRIRGGHVEWNESARAVQLHLAQAFHLPNNDAGLLTPGA